MLRFIALCVLAVGCYASPISKIVGGTNAKLGEFPYIVSLRYYNSHSCGGSIIDATHILTAAHCVDGRTGNPSTFSIQYGVTKISSGTNVITASKVVAHPNYQAGGGYPNDVAVITLQSAIPFSANVQPAALPPAFNSTPENQDAVLAGWGYPYSGGGVMQDLQRVDILAYSDEDCESAHSGRTSREFHVCAGVPEGGKGQCSGDSGGPLTVKGVQVGVVSWSVKPCTVKGYPGVFAKVSQYMDWIMEQTK